MLPIAQAASGKSVVRHEDSSRPDMATGTPVSQEGQPMDVNVPSESFS